MKARQPRAWKIVCFATVAACGHTSTIDLPMRPANDVPVNFVLDPADPDAPQVPPPGQGCRSPLFDPRDGTRLRMIRSAADAADYEAPSGRYGLGRDEVLRIRCSTGEPLGIVARGVA